MLVPTQPPPRHAAPVMPLDGVPLRTDPRLFRPPTARRSEFKTTRGVVLLRPVNPTDLAGVDTFVRRLSAASRFARFHGGMHHLSPRQLAGVVDVDHHDRETLVALARGRVVGLGQYLPQAQPAGAVELAVVVADRWQRQGIGRALLTGLAGAAADTGATVATVMVQADNRPVLHLLRGLGDRAELVHTGRTVEALIHL